MLKGLKKTKAHALEYRRLFDGTITPTLTEERRKSTRWQQYGPLPYYAFDDGIVVSTARPLF